MPRLALEDNPPQIFSAKAGRSFGGQEAYEPEIADLAAAAASWFIFKSKPNREKRLAFDLIRQEVSYYLPMQKRRTQMPSSREKRLTFKPFFPGFIFVAADPGRTIRSMHLFRADSVHEDWKLVKELAELKSEIDSGRLRSMAQLVEGRQCRVTEGAFCGCEGTLQRLDYRKRFGFLVCMLGEIRIDVEALELV